MHGSLGPPLVLNLNGISIGSAIFAELTTVTERQTKHATRSVAIGHIYVRSTAMHPNNNEINNEKFCTQFCVLMLLRCFKLASPLHCYDWPDQSLSSNVSRLTQGWPSSNRMEHFQKSKLSRGRLASSRGFENAFGNGLSCCTVKLFSAVTLGTGQL